MVCECGCGMMVRFENKFIFNHHRKGIPIPESTRQKQREGRKGKKHTKESRKKMSLARKGKIKNTPEDFWDKCHKSEGCWEWAGSRNRDGYGWFCFNGKTQGTHRLAWQLTHGSIPKGMSVLHKCDNPPCVNPDHLFIGTQGDNIRDAFSKNKMPIGSERSASKLAERQVRLIKDDLKDAAVNYSELGRRFGVSTSVIYDIRDGVTWRHI